jgi:hypothetical protein
MLVLEKGSLQTVSTHHNGFISIEHIEIYFKIKNYYFYICILSSFTSTASQYIKFCFNFKNDPKLGSFKNV